MAISTKIVRTCHLTSSDGSDPSLVWEKLNLISVVLGKTPRAQSDTQKSAIARLFFENMQLIPGGFTIAAMISQVNPRDIRCRNVAEKYLKAFETC